MGITARLSKDRLAEQLSALAQIGADAEGGVTRLPYTEAERDAVDFVKNIMEEAGLSACFDAFGNLYGRLEGSDRSRPAVMSGSHIDTVINGGSYDGAVGVLAAIEALRAIREVKMPHKHPLVAAVFVSEEAARFGAGTLGSRAVVGDLCRADLNRLKDRNGITLAQALMQWGYNPDKLEDARIGPEQLKCFVELHIEQSVVLENCGVSLGIVDRIAAPTNLRLTFSGQAGHAGATPMGLRRDAFAAAAEVTLAVEDIVRKTGPETVGTVGEVYVVPNAINVISGRVILGVDIRDISAGRKDQAVEKLKEAAAVIAEKRNVKIEADLISRMAPQKTSPHIVRLISSVCEQLSLPSINIASGAYHDALNMAKITDIGMIFIPSAGGVSHAAGEYTHIDDIYRGAQVLAAVLAELANS